MFFKQHVSLCERPRFTCYNDVGESEQKLQARFSSEGKIERCCEKIPKTGPAKGYKTMKGKFITFEGSEGCGKSTQSKLLYLYLKKKGYRALYLREPGGVAISEKIRKILLDPRNKNMSPLCETLLYMASRAQVIEEVILPAIKKGRIVICDRFLDSTLVYQGYGLGIDIESILRIGDFATAGLKPDLTILLDLAVKKGLEYRSGKKDRIEQRSFRYHFKVRKGYLTLAAEEPKRIRVIKIAKDKSVTQKRIRLLVDKLLKG